MRIYVAHARSHDFEAELYPALRGTAAYEEHMFVLPHATAGVHVDSLPVIAVSDLVLAEASHPSTGLGIELGWAKARNIPVVLLLRSDAKPSRSLDAISSDRIIYTSVDDLAAKIEARFGH